MNTVFLKSSFGGIEIGDWQSVRVNCNVGANTPKQMDYEQERLRAIKDSNLLPDTFMDLSIGRYDEPLYKYIIREFGCPVGGVPAYGFPSSRITSQQEALDILKMLADDGIAFLTLHMTANRDLLEIAKRTRKIPVTSRGGAIVLRQAKESSSENLWVSILPQIVDLAKDYGIVISLGSTFRPAGIDEACDEVHLQETEEQLKYCKLLQKEGVQVMVENIGHIALNRLEEHCKRLRQFDAPIMPLGPLPTDCAEDEDHIAAAIGASMMGYWNCAHIINCVTRSEHTKPFFRVDETLEAIRTAKLAAHIIDVARGINLKKDTEMLNMRANNHNCIIDKRTDCNRCSMFCPLYSVSGYPCLYISRSIWATWEEMHEPKLSDFTVSRLELQQDFRVLDLRVPIVEDDKDTSRLARQLYTIPLILACSVKVKYPKDNFKPEYIMPQLVMLAITYHDVEFMGCAYTSTMRNTVFSWADIRLLDNIALPVFSVNTTGKLCPKLCSLFKVSDSTNYDYEMLKKPFETLFWTVIEEKAVIDEAEKYSSSIFGQIEERLARKGVVQLNPA